MLTNKFYKFLKRLFYAGTYVVFIIFVAVFSWRIANSSFTLDLSNFKFSDLLALIMGLFAIGMSVAFFFKATDISNKFYDNVYRFTQETSELLGRIEAGFGERLKHMDEGLVGMRDQLSKIPFDDEKLKNDIEEKDQQIKKLQQKYNTELAGLAEKTQLQKQEKSEILGEIQKLQNRLAEVKAEKAGLDKLKEEDKYNINLTVADQIVGLIGRTPWSQKETAERYQDEMFNWLSSRLTASVRNYLIDRGLFFGGAVTKEGRKVILDLLTKYLWSEK